jgi:hypothetical protein
VRDPIAGKRELLRHFLAALAYRTQKALANAPPEFGSFRAREGVRTPQELMQHMSGLIDHTLAVLRDEVPTPLDPVPGLREEVARFHERLTHLSDLLLAAPLQQPGLPERLLQGPLGDAMTHAGQLALLRRLAGAPIEAENFFRAPIHAANVGSEQPLATKVGLR